MIVLVLFTGCLDVVQHGVPVGVTLNLLDCAGASVVDGASELRFTAKSGNTILLSRTSAIGSPPGAVGLPEGTDVQLRVEAIDASGTVIARGSSVHFDVVAAAPTPQLTVVLYPVDRFSRVCATLATARAFHTATQLQDGRVLIVGGQGNAGEPLSSMEVLSGADLLDAGSLALSSGPNVFRLPRAHHTATLTDVGQVVISGGESATTPLSSVLFIDPPSNFGIGALGPVSQHQPRSRHAAFKVGTTVFFFGGTSAQAVPNGVVERLELTTNQLTPVATLGEPRLEAALAQLGSVAIVAGGLEATGASAHVDLLPLNTPGAFVRLTLATPRTNATAIAVGDRVLVAGGVDRAGAPLGSTEWLRLSPAGVEAGPSITPRAALCAASLPGARALLIGGIDTSGASAATELVSEDGTRVELTPPGPARVGHACLSLDDGSVLVIGGLDGAGRPLADVWRYMPR